MATAQSFRQSALALACRPGFARRAPGSGPLPAARGLAGYHPFMAQRRGGGAPASPLPSSPPPRSRPLKRAAYGGAQASHTASPAGAQARVHVQISRAAKKTARRRRLVSSVTAPPLPPWRFVPARVPAETERPARPLPPPARGSGSMGAEELADFIAACEGRISWAQYHLKWGGGRVPR